MADDPPGTTGDLFRNPPHPDRDNSRSWPAAERFPLNLPGSNVGDTVAADLEASSDPLLVAGYASLDRIIDFAGAGGPERLRLLFGTEPSASQSGTYTLETDELPAELKRYWLERGVSPRLSARVIRFLEALEDGRIQARFLGTGQRRLHAKIYVADGFATVGSSNFTHPGLTTNWEANARFSAAREPARYRELASIGENYWAMGQDFSRELIDLLHRLLRVVTWPEALARACAELLEGEWASSLLQIRPGTGGSALWPSQRQGIAQALYILDRRGSVLVADAAGSGKTRLGAHLVRALQDRLARSGDLGHHQAVMVSPPAVSADWQREAVQAGASLQAYSQGKLSRTSTGSRPLSVEALRRARILCVDEGHNFLNVRSNRTQHLLHHMADHVVLFTATPLNRSTTDLLRIADLLGADNLDPSTLDSFRRMLRQGKLSDSLTPEELADLRGEIRKFTVRRTRGMLNAMIDQAPESYRDPNDRPCRFPEHRPRLYPMGEPASDRQLARAIRDLAEQLYGVTHLTGTISLPAALARQGWDESKFLESRLLAARHITRYGVLAALRSSRGALIEHLLGTGQAMREFDLDETVKTANSGNLLGTIENRRGRPPRNDLAIALPDWLADPDRHAAACDHDYRILTEILAKVRAMSGTREQVKAQQVAELAGRHRLLLAFDHRPITLAFIAKLIGLRRDHPRILLATGGRAAGRKAVMSAFHPAAVADAEPVIGLCSDSLSESVNLQGASCLVHLDMPSVVRTAEQRAGRVDRLDSPHQAVEVWWPEDAAEFALTSDERFVQRHDNVVSLLGANLSLPAGLHGGPETTVDYQRLVAEYEQTAVADWDQGDDAFAGVRGLVQGEGALVDEATYRSYRGVTDRVMARVSIVQDETAWAFFCLAGDRGRAPRWLSLPDDGQPAVTDLDRITAFLRQRLGPEIPSGAMTEGAADLLGRFVEQLNRSQRAFLARRKQRALVEMAAVLRGFRAEAARRADTEALDGYDRLLTHVERPDPERPPDWEELATRWLDVIRPVWYQRLQEPGRRQPLLLADVRDDLIAREAELGPEVLDRFAAFPAQEALERRLVAAIIGYPGQPATA